MTLFLIFLWMIDLYIDGVGVFKSKGVDIQSGRILQIGSTREREMDIYKILLKDVMDVNSKVL